MVGIKKNRLEALFFDFDGVIVDSTATKIEGFRLLFEHVDSTSLAKILDYHRRHGGISRVEKIRHAYDNILGLPLTEAEKMRLARRYSEFVVDGVLRAAPIPGAQEALAELAPSFPLFLISGTPQEELRYIVRQRRLAGYFREVLGSPIKKPAHIVGLLDRYKFTAQGCIMIGDSLTDYEAAQETGLAFVGVAGEVDFPSDTLVLPDCRRLVDQLAKMFDVSIP